jgi:hypothetical protein
MNIFSNVAWGLGTRATTVAAGFLALSAIVSGPRHFWVKTLLAGFAVGLGVMEGADNGAILSLIIAAFVLFNALVAGENTTSRLKAGPVRLALVVLFAALTAYHTIGYQFELQIKNVTASDVQEMTAEEKWLQATSWSLPPNEISRVLVPGLFGYRMDTPDGGNYWGRVGEGPGMARFSGAGEYTGVVVVLFALFAIYEAFRRDRSSLTPLERKYVFFWAVTAVVCVLLAFGRYAPFYQLIYKLPYFSNIRAPMKWMHPFNLSMLILFGYSLLAISRRFMADAGGAKTGLSAKIAVPKPVESSDKPWFIFLFSFVGISVLAAIIYTSSQRDLIRYLSPQFGPELGAAIAKFSLNEVYLFVVFAVLATGLFVLIHKRKLATVPSLGWILLGLLVVIDLGRADKPWIKYWNYQDKYASNPVIDFLKDRPYEKRVASLPVQTPNMQTFNALYEIEWKQHHFPYFNIQNLTVSQEPRMAADKKAYMMNFTNAPMPMVKQWELTSTRYILTGGEQVVAGLNQQLAGGSNLFRLISAFDLALKPGRTEFRGNSEDLTIQLKPSGEFGLVEFLGALPRASLYSQWVVSTNDKAFLPTLVSPSFDPHKTVMISGDFSKQPKTSSAPFDGKVEFKNYEPKKIELATSSNEESVLLLNDKYDPSWKVYLDDKPAELLRANYIMRGVFVPSGNHKVVFSFEPKNTGFLVSLLAVVTGLVLSGFLFISTREDKK